LRTRFARRSRLAFVPGEKNRPGAEAKHDGGNQQQFPGPFPLRARRGTPGGIAAFRRAQFVRVSHITSSDAYTPDKFQKM
jgi:hypothetical protein